MKHILVLFLSILCLGAVNVQANDNQLKQVYEAHQSDIQIRGSGTVSRLLPDDNKGSRHQKFILRLDSNQTLLVAHNIDLAPRLDGLKLGDRVEFYGEYEWNNKGGVIHWTHRDPGNKHAHGWLEYAGRVFE